MEPKIGAGHEKAPGLAWMKSRYAAIQAGAAAGHGPVELATATGLPLGTVAIVLSAAASHGPENH